MSYIIVAVAVLAIFFAGYALGVNEKEQRRADRGEG
jgi:uncharacterized membrane protein YciS (DUF1049 family)